MCFIVEFLNKANIDQELYSNLRFLVAIYGPKYDQLWLMDGNEYGRRNVRASVIQRSENSYILEILIRLYNGSILTIRDDAGSMLQLASHLVDLSEGVNKLLDDME